MEIVEIEGENCIEVLALAPSTQSCTFGPTVQTNPEFWIPANTFF